MKRKIAGLLCFIMIFTFSFSSIAKADDVINLTVERIMKSIENPTVSSAGGEWAVIGLARSGVKSYDSFFETYIKNVKNYVKASNGVLHTRKYTEYARVVLCLTAIGENPENFAGYNLVEALYDYEKTVFQGINGAVWALIALDSGDYGTEEIREKYIEYILSRELQDGGFSLNSEASEPDADISAMALVALSKYKSRENVSKVIERGINKLSQMQNDNGGFSNGKEESCESTAQVLTALFTLGINEDDVRFVKNGITAFDNLMSYYKDGGFSHLSGGEMNLMATEQAFYALVSKKRFENGESAIFDMGMQKKSKLAESVYMLLLKRGMIK